MPDGRFEQPHEHLWHVTVTFRAEALDATTGVVIDFVKVQAALESIGGELEGADLNALAPFADGGSSAERLAEFLAGRLLARIDAGQILYRVGVTEAPGCSAAFYPDRGQA